MLISTNTGLYSARKGKVRIPMVEAIDFFADAGFEAVDVNFCAIIYNEEFRHENILDGDNWKANLDPLVERIKERGLVISHSHPPFFNYCNTALPEYDFKCKMLCRGIEASAYIGAPWAVLHVDKNPELGTVKGTVEGIKPYMELAHKLDIGIAVENNFSASPDDLLEICDAYDNDHIGICWDIGHANHEPCFDPAEGIMKMGKTLKVVHLHDNYGTKDNHNAPYFGNINWDAVTHALLHSGYEGTFNYEVSASQVSEYVRMEHAKYLVAVARDLLNRNA